MSNFIRPFVTALLAIGAFAPIYNVAAAEQQEATVVDGMEIGRAHV